MRDFLKGFFYAFRGITDCVCNERNMRIHIVIAVYVLFFSQFYNLSNAKLAIVLVVIAAVLSLELLNTAIERACDAITRTNSQLIKIAKDVSAGAVLVMAVTAAFTGILIFWDTDILWTIISIMCNTPEYLTIFILSILVSILFIIIGPKGIVNNIKAFVEFKKSLKNEDTLSENIEEK